MPPCDLYQWDTAPSTLLCLIQSNPHLLPSHCSSHPIRYIEYVSQVFPLAYSPLERFYPSARNSSTISIVLKSAYVKNALCHIETLLWKGHSVHCRAYNPSPAFMGSSFLKKGWYLKVQLIHWLLYIQRCGKLPNFFLSWDSFLFNHL